ncbi:uncharacterized protein LOC144650505 [Oculina patagonica]
MKFHLKSSKYLTVCIAVIVLVLLIAGEYLWNGAAVDDYGSSPLQVDSTLNQSLSVSKYSHCIPGSLPDSLAKLYELYDGVETFVMFIGYPRSSHSLVGAILDAHPEIIIPHEYHIVEHWDIYRDDALKNSGMQKYLLFYNLHSLSTWQATFGNRAEKPIFIDDRIYSYNVPGAWQGTFNGKLKIIGDKKGGGTTMELTEKPEKFSILKELNDTVDIPLKFLHVIRNPFDVISTWVLRLFKARLKVNDGTTEMNKPGALNNAIKSFFELIETNERIRQLYGDAVLDVLSHELILKPRATMERICTFLGVTCTEDYINQAENILFGKPSETRRTVVWTEEQKQRVYDEMKKYSFLQSFSFEGD